MNNEFFIYKRIGQIVKRLEINFISQNEAVPALVSVSWLFKEK